MDIGWVQEMEGFKSFSKSGCEGSGVGAHQTKRIVKNQVWVPKAQRLVPMTEMLVSFRVRLGPQGGHGWTNWRILGGLWCPRRLRRHNLEPLLKWIKG